MKPIVSIFAQGTMGAGLAGVLTRHGLTVRTALEGRSTASAARAEAAGMQPVPFERLVEADIVLSVMPPAEALPFAERLAPHVAAATRKPLFVDCNAISPGTLHRVAAVLAGSGAPFADIGIIGMPPREGATQPRLFAAGADLALLGTLRDFGLDVRPMDGPPGTASALKMAYGGITKGLIAIASAMILGGDRSHIASALCKELSTSEPELFASLGRRVQDMLPKAYRWVAEMEEISEFLKDDAASSAMYQNIAKLYARLAADVDGPAREANVLKNFFSTQPETRNQHSPSRPQN